jgi:1-acyl-sn-glycerol-3-phosphate acyltransferase
MSSLRAAGILAGFLLLTLPLLPLQYALVKLRSPHARALPHWYHKRVCALMGVRLRIEGEIARDRPVLLVSNHVSWLDIVTLSAVAPVSFIAKSEVDGWPFINLLARLQRTVFVNRSRRVEVRDKAMEIGGRLAGGDCLVLFAEGTSGDGNGVLPFKSSLFAAVSDFTPGGGDAAVQTCAIGYTHLNGLPFNRNQRPLVAWYGDMEIAGHAWALLKAGPLDARIRLGPPRPMADFSGRKDVAAYAERRIRRDFTEMLTGRREPPSLAAQEKADARADG